MKIDNVWEKLSLEEKGWFIKDNFAEISCFLDFNKMEYCNINEIEQIWKALRPRLQQEFVNKYSKDFIALIGADGFLEDVNLRDFAYEIDDDRANELVSALRHYEKGGLK